MGLRGTGGRSLGIVAINNRAAFGMIRCIAVMVFGFCAVLPAWGQQCPRPDADTVSQPSAARGLEGTLLFHNGLRQWFELKLAQPQCGQVSVQLIMKENVDETPLEVLRGCRVKSTGALDFSPTGYYSLDLFQAVEQINAVAPCRRQPPLPLPPAAKPDQAVRKYRVDMFVNDGPGDHPIVFRIHSGKKELRPWQAYASYWLTGSFVLYGSCGDGFSVDQVFGTASANPQVIDVAAFDLSGPEGPAAAGHRKLHLGYTCVRD